MNTEGEKMEEVNKTEECSCCCSDKGKFAKIIPAVLLGLILLASVGVYAYSLGKKSVLKNPPVTQNPKSTEITPISDEISNWKTYSGEGFSIKIPNGWNFDGQVLANFDYTKLLPKTDFPKGSVKCDFVSYDSTRNIKSVENFINEEIQVKKGKIVFSASETMSGTSGEYTYFLIQRKNSSKGLTCFAYDLRQEPVVNQILSTFKFTDQTSEIRKINYQKVTGWTEFLSNTGYSFYHPKEFLNPPVLVPEQKTTNGCAISFGNDNGAAINMQIVQNSGSSLKDAYPLDAKYSYKFEDVLIQGKKSLLVDGQAKDGTRTDKGVVIPIDNHALVVSFSEPLSGTSSLRVEGFEKLIGSIKFENLLDLTKCGK